MIFKWRINNYILHTDRKYILFSIDLSLKYAMLNSSAFFDEPIISTIVFSIISLIFYGSCCFFN